MAGLIKSMCTILMVATLLASIVHQGEAAIGCGAVAGALGPCIGYLGGRAPIGPCCSGIRRLNGAARSTPDRQSVCTCLKGLARSYPTLAPKAGSVLRQCGVRLGYSISPSTNCATVR